ncbi:GTPase-activating protein GYP5, partial [Durusdinium trenchii]
MECLKGCSCLTALFLSRPECLDETQRLQLWSGVHLNELPEESMRSLVRAGVPSSLRWSLWTSHLRAAPRGSAQWPAEGTTPCAPPLEVAADAARTSLGGKRLVEEEVKSLEKVCAAYASRDPVIGYCQGMNFVVAVLLLASGGDEMETFQCFVGLVRHLDLVTFYADGFPRLREYVDESCKLLPLFLPKLSHHFELNGILPEQFLHSWHLTLFASCLPRAAILEVWDDIICCSGTELLVPLAIALLELLLRSSGSEISRSLRSVPRGEQDAQTLGFELRRRSHEIWSSWPHRTRK